jgi:hypothetical protein
MFIEGIIDKAYYALLVDACYDIVWVCESGEDAVKYGYDFESYEMAEKAGECIARIFVDCNVEDYFTVQTILEAGDREQLLPLMAVSKNEVICEFAEKELRK